MIRRGRRGRVFRILSAFGVMAGLAGGTAEAQVRPLDVPANVGWQHAETGLVLRARLAGYQRTSIEDNGVAELDVFAKYETPDRATFVTIYVFRPALMNVPVWFDRSEAQILLRSDYRGAQPAGEARAFAPPRSGIASGLRNSYVTGLDAHRTTAVAVMPMGEWLVKVRISSSNTDPAAIESGLDAVIAAIGWPDDVRDAVPASLVASCARPLSFARRARLQRPSVADALLGGLLSNAVVDEDDPDTDAAPVVFCRDAPGTLQYGVYRDANDPRRNSYVMAIGDAGRTISVAPSLNGLLNGRKGYMLSLGELDSILIFPNFDKLATPDRAFEVVTGSAPISSIVRGQDGGNTITIGAGLD